MAELRRKYEVREEKEREYVQVTRLTDTKNEKEKKTDYERGEGPDKKKEDLETINQREDTTTTKAKTKTITKIKRLKGEITKDKINNAKTNHKIVVDTTHRLAILVGLPGEPRLARPETKPNLNFGPMGVEGGERPMNSQVMGGTSAYFPQLEIVLG